MYHYARSGIQLSLADARDHPVAGAICLRKGDFRLSPVVIKAPIQQPNNNRFIQNLWESMMRVNHNSCCYKLKYKSCGRECMKQFVEPKPFIRKVRLLHSVDK